MQNNKKGDFSSHLFYLICHTRQLIAPAEVPSPLAIDVGCKVGG